uniref:Uncharacterized protein n=1 Tax=Globisporangium ultimum (strain ATCC 200006 / CBS 805.95 / DAOM BR144) TaxID=431595 RepID=K3X2X8_GLOUD
MTEKVVVLSHVKMSSIPPGASSARRIPWLGGTIKSNKEEALRKFYERKITTGAPLNDHQVQALQKTLGITVDDVQKQKRQQMTAKSASHHPKAHMNPKKLHATHRPHGKVQASANKTIVINGRVLGPKVMSKHNKAQTTRQPQLATKILHVGSNSKSNSKKSKPTTKSELTASSLALEDKLHLPLDALVKRSKK